MERNFIVTVRNSCRNDINSYWCNNIILGTVYLTCWNTTMMDNGCCEILSV